MVSPRTRTTRSLVAFTMALLAMGAAHDALAVQPPQIEASVSSDEIALDQTLQLTVRVGRDATQLYQGYVRPEPKDFDILSTQESESTQWTIINGQQSTRTIETHQYVLRPKHKGASTIPAAVARIDGHELRTREFVVRVTPASNKPGAQAQARQVAPGVNILDPFGTMPGFGQVTEPDGMRGDEDVFIEAKADKATAYVGEQVIVTWKLFARADILRYRTTTEPRHDDFWNEELYAPPGRLSWERQTVKGQEYQAATLLKRALFPLKSGRLTVTELDAEVTTLQTAFYAGGSAVRRSKPLVIEVLPLPASGRPDGFESTNVGHFEVVGSADKTQVNAGEAITYRLLVKGQGNLRNLKVPRFDQIAGFKVYEPTVTDAVQKLDGGVEGMKIFNYLLLPRKSGDLHIPPITLTYFDPTLKKYETATVNEIKVTVSGDPDKIGSPTKESNENVLDKKIKPLRIKRHVESHLGELLLRGHALPIALAIPPAALLGLIGFATLRGLLRRETAGTRRRKARAAARRRMKQAEVHLKAQRPGQFFGECTRAIYEHLEFRLGSKCEAYTMDELRRVLGGRGFDEELAAKVAAELETCDFARFAAASSSDPVEMRAALRRVKELLDEIERARLPGGSGGAQTGAAA